MPRLVCPHCDCFAYFRLRWKHEVHYSDPFDIPSIIGACYTCDSCEKPIASILDPHTEALSEYWPTKIVDNSFPDVPKSIESTANEAHRCLAANSPRGAVALARAVVESVAKDKGIVKGGLESKIETLYKKGHISEAMMEAAHEIRFAGNEVAHGDLVAEQLAIDNAQDIVDLMDTMLERIYQEPAKVARIREQRESRKTKSVSKQEGEDPVDTEEWPDEQPF